MLGTVYKLIPSKGFGFIRDPEGRERFMHVSDCQPRHLFELLREGQTVEFTPMNTKQGLRATEVRLCATS